MALGNFRAGNKFLYVNEEKPGNSFMGAQENHQIPLCVHRKTTEFLYVTTQEAENSFMCLGRRFQFWRHGWKPLGNESFRDTCKLGFGGGGGSGSEGGEG